MGQRRYQLQTLLESLSEPPLDVYFEPPTGAQMSYPCITYERDFVKTAHADNRPYTSRKRYLVTVIDRDPDSLIPDKVSELPSAAFNRAFKTEGLNHSIYTLFY